jgi:hypothetical protein
MLTYYPVISASISEHLYVSLTVTQYVTLHFVGLHIDDIVHCSADAVVVAYIARQCYVRLLVETALENVDAAASPMKSFMERKRLTRISCGKKILTQSAFWLFVCFKVRFCTIRLIGCDGQGSGQNSGAADDKRNTMAHFDIYSTIISIPCYATSKIISSTIQI